MTNTTPQRPDIGELDNFTRTYLVCALWSSTDDHDEPLDANYGIEDIATPTLIQMVEDCRQFNANNAEVLERAYARNGYSPDKAGHDLWLTRNHHGAGFWDRGLETIGRRLTDAAHALGEWNLYIGDDGKIYGM